MTLILRRGTPLAIPDDGIRIAQPVSWQHAWALARNCNELELAGGTLFYNAPNLTLSGEGSSVLTGTFHHRCPIRKNMTHRIWVLSVADQDCAGIVRLIPSIPPDNQSEEQWATGRGVPPRRTSGYVRLPSPLLYWEEIDQSSYASPDPAYDVGYQIQWVPSAGAGAEITIRSIGCYELDLGSLDSGAYAVLESYFRPRNPILSGSADNSDGAIRQIAAIIDRIKKSSLHRYLFGISYPDDDVAYLATSSSHVATNPFVIDPLVNPFRFARQDPGWSTVDCVVRAFARNSATTGGSVFASTFQAAPELTGFPIGSYDWVEETLVVTCGKTGNRATPTVTGFQTGAAATDEEPEEETMTMEDVVTCTVRGKPTSGASANTLDVLSLEIVQILPLT